MKEAFFLSRNAEELESLYHFLPYLREIIGGRRVSVIELMTPDELLKYHYDSAEATRAVHSRIVMLKDGKVVKEVPFSEIHAHRKKRNLPEPNLHSPETEIRGNEDVCIIVHDHADDPKSIFDGISVEIFVCAKGQTFAEYPEVRGWIAGYLVQEKLSRFGIL
jgi:hypothetical protein